MSSVIGVLPLVVLFVVAFVTPLLSQRIVERALVNSRGWQQRDARTRRQLSRLPGALLVCVVVLVYFLADQHWL